MSGGSTTTTTSDYEIKYAAHMEAYHKELLNNTGADTLLFSVTDAINDASSYVGGSPFAGATAYDPTEEIDATKSRLDEFLSRVDDMSPGTDLAAAIAFAADQYETSGELNLIDTYVTSMETRQRSSFARQSANVLSGCFDIRGVMTTQFGFTLGNMEAERSNNLDTADAELRLQAYVRAQQTILGIAEQYLRYIQMRLQANQAATGLQSDVGRLAIVAKQDQVAFDLDTLVKDKTWDLELLGYGSNTLSSISGSAVLPRAQTQKERLLGAITTSLSTGLQAGVSASMFGPEAAIGVGAGSALLTFAAQMWGMS